MTRPMKRLFGRSRLIRRSQIARRLPEAQSVIALLTFLALPLLAQAQDATNWPWAVQYGGAFNWVYATTDGAGDDYDMTAPDSVLYEVFRRPTFATDTRVASFNCADDSELTCADGSLTFAIPAASLACTGNCYHRLRIVTSGLSEVPFSGLIEIKPPGQIGGGANTTTTMTFAGSSGTLTFTSGGTSGGYATIQDEASALTERTTINFTGAGVTCADNAGASRTDCTITSGGGSGTMTTVKESDVQIGGADIAAIDFGPGFDCAESPDTEINCLLDYTEDPVDLSTSEITGTLPVANGGTGVTSLTDLVTPTVLDDDANTPTAGYIVVVETGAASFDYLDPATFAAASHSHAASDITSGTLAHERGGLEADLSAYNGLVRITGGATSNVTNLAGLNTALGSSIADGAHTTDTDFTDTVTHEQIPFERSTTVAGTDSLIWDGSAGALTVDGNIAVTGTVDGVDIAARDHAAVTVSGTPDYITLSGQDLVRGTVDLAADVTGTLPAGNGGTGTTSLTDLVTPTILDDDANTPVAGYAVIVEVGAASFDYLDLSAVYQPLDSDLTDLADGSLTGTKVGFADTNGDFAATDVQSAIEELVSVNGSGINAADGKVEWTQLVGVPAGFADGTDDGAGGSGDEANVNGVALANFNLTDSTQIGYAINRTADPDEISPYLITVSGVTGADEDDLSDDDLSALQNVSETGEGNGIPLVGDGSGGWEPANDSLIAFPTRFPVVGGSDPIISVLDGVLNISRGALQVGGSAVLTAETNDLEGDGASGIADTEIPIGTGAGTVNYAAISGDASLANTGALTVSDLTCTDCINATEIEDIYLANNGDDATTGDITVGGGEVVLGSTTQDGTLVIHDDDVGGDATVTIQAADATGTSYTLTLPPNDGDAGQQLQTNGSGVLTWEAAGSGTGAFDDSSDPVVLNTTTKDVVIGTAQVNTSKLTIDGDADQVQLTIDQNGTQTDAPLIIEDGSTNEVMTVEPGGLLTTAVGLDAIGAVDMDYGSADVTDHTFITDGTGDAEIVLPDDSIGSSEIDTIVESFVWPAGAMVSDGTNCAAAASNTIGTNGPAYTVICTDNDASTVYGDLLMPDSWNGGTVVFKIAVIQDAADTGNLQADISAQCRGDTEAAGGFGTEIAMDDTMTGSDAVNIVASAAVTPTGTCAGGDWLQWRWQMDAAGTTTAVATLNIMSMVMEWTSTVGD